MFYAPDKFERLFLTFLTCRQYHKTKKMRVNKKALMPGSVHKGMSHPRKLGAVRRKLRRNFEISWVPIKISLLFGRFYPGHLICLENL